ncbi:ParB N-terminal domain-containing protein [Nocardia sp. NPDC050435]|uniref:ParB/RepB/Spo0J family partition protein n=1 Tax=Nocardia sp. NPDC050435 TaxID=3155040 RepID=UPI0033D5D53B
MPATATVAETETDRATTTLTVVPDTVDTADNLEDSPAAGESTSLPADLPEIGVQWVRVTDVVLADNVRKTFDLAEHPDQVASIREFGVRDPINAIREADGRIVAYDGQLRLLIAAEVGLEYVPVYFTAAPEGVSANERAIIRTRDQIMFNDRRIGLTKGDRARGIADMLDLGATPTRIARELQMKRDEVKTAAKIGASPTARALADGHQFSFDELAIIGHYEALGDTDAVRRLTASGGYGFRYETQRIVDEHDATRATLRASLPYGARGFGVLTAEPDTSGEDAQFLPAELLVDAEGEPLTVEAIDADPSRYVVYLEREDATDLVNKATGEIVDRDAVDWSTEDDAEATAGSGLLHVGQVEERERWTPLIYLPARALAESGLHLQAPALDEAAQVAAALEAQRAAEEREHARQARRRVIELNKRGDAANKRREEITKEFLERRTPPTQAAKFVAGSMARALEPRELQIVLRWLGVGGSRDSLLQAIESASVQRAWVIVLAMAMAPHALAIGKSLWRDAGPGTARYLRFLAEVAASNDFALLDVEQAAVGEIDYNTIDIAA